MSACSSGAARDRRRRMRMIQYGDADAVVAGGAEAGAHAALAGRLRRAGRALGERHLAALRRPPRRLRDGRGGRRAGARERASGARARRAHARRVMRGYGATADAYHLTAPQPDGDGAAAAMERALADAGVRPERRRLRQRPRHLDAAQRPRRDDRDQGGVRRARGRDPGLLDEVRDRAPARRRRARSRRSRRSSPCATGSSRRRSAGRSATRAWTSTTCPAAPRPLALPNGAAARSRSPTHSASAATTPSCACRAHERVVDRPGAGAERSGVRADARDRPDERLSALERLEVLATPGRCELAAHARAARAGWASGRGPATACSPPRRASTAARSPASPRTPTFAGGSLGEAHAETVVADARAGRPRAGAGDRLRRVGRRAHAGGPRGARRLRARSSASTSRSRAGAADLDDLRPLGRRGSYAPALTDFVIMTERASMFLTGPGGRRGGDRARSSTRARSAAPACTSATASAI